MNNNVCVAGDEEGVLKGYNLSTGKPLSGLCKCLLRGLQPLKTTHYRKFKVCDCSSGFKGLQHPRNCVGDQHTYVNVLVQAPVWLGLNRWYVSVSLCGYVDITCLYVILSLESHEVNSQFGLFSATCENLHIYYCVQCRSIINLFRIVFLCLKLKLAYIFSNVLAVLYCQ